MKASISNPSTKEVRCRGKTCDPWSKFTRSGVRDGAGGPDCPMLPCNSSRVSLLGIYIVKIEDGWPCAMNQQFPIRRAAWIAVFWKCCGKQREKWLTDFVRHQLWVGVERCVGSQISKVRHNGLASKAVHTPTETTKPCSCNFRNTHVYKSSNWTPNYTSEAVCLGFSQVPEALVIFGFGNRVEFNWQDIIKSKLTWTDKPQHMRVTYNIRYHLWVAP